MKWSLRNRVVSQIRLDFAAVWHSSLEKVDRHTNFRCSDCYRMAQTHKHPEYNHLTIKLLAVYPVSTLSSTQNTNH